MIQVQSGASPGVLPFIFGSNLFLKRMRVTFDLTVTFYEVENYREINYQMCREAMSNFLENLDYKRYIGPISFRRQCTLPNSAYNTFLNTQTFIK